MHGTAEIIDEAVSLPIEERMHVIESLLRSVNPTDSAIDELWADEAVRRLDSVKDGSMNTVDGESVFDKIRKRYS